MSIHDTFIHNIPKLETTQIIIMLYIHTGEFKKK